MSRIFDPSREAIKEMLGFDLAQTRAGQDIFQAGMQKGIEEGIEQCIEQGRLEGIEKSRLEGREEGRLEGLIEAIKLGMGLKFGIEGVKLLPRIEKEKDITRIDAIKEAIRIATSVKEIEELLID